MLHAKLGSLPAPYPSFGVANNAFLHDKARLLIGHGFETVARGVHAEILPPETPRALAFEIWYELGIVGALIAAAGVWLAFRSIGAAPPRLAPYLAATLACNLTLGVPVLRPVGHDVADAAGDRRRRHRTSRRTASIAPPARRRPISRISRRRAAACASHASDLSAPGPNWAAKNAQ